MNQYKVCKKCFHHFDILLKSLSGEISKKLRITSKNSNNSSSIFLLDLNDTLDKFLKKIYILLHTNKNIKKYIKSVLGNRKKNNLEEKIDKMKKILNKKKKSILKKESLIRIIDNEENEDKSDIDDLLSNINLQSIDSNSMDLDILNSNRNIPGSKRKYKNKLDKIIKNKNKSKIEGIKEKFLKTISYKRKKEKVALKQKFFKKTLKGKSIVPKIDDLDISHLKKYKRPQTSHLIKRKYLSLINDYDKKNKYDYGSNNDSLLSNKSDKKNKKKPMTLSRLILTKKKSSSSNLELPFKETKKKSIFAKVTRKKRK